MAQKIKTTRPDRPISGNSVTKDSIAGRKTQFVLQSTVASTSFTLGAGSTQHISVTSDFWAEDLPIESRNETNIISPDETIIFPQIDAYVDNDLDGNYYLGGGISMSPGQLSVTLSYFVGKSPPVYGVSGSDSALHIFTFHNFDSSSHVIYMYAVSKYIVFADVNL